MRQKSLFSEIDRRIELLQLTQASKPGETWYQMQASTCEAGLQNRVRNRARNRSRTSANFPMRHRTKRKNSKRIQ